jgi:acylphosphatase
MAQAARHLFYTGHVQGVGFRYSIKQIASGFDVTGYVCNLPDGQVELWIQGDKPELLAMEEDVLKSHLKGFIREIKALDQARDPSLRGFEIRK